MKSIGGYFELEVSNNGKHYHDTPYRLKSARAALLYILNTVKPSLVYVPYYTCDSLLEPFTVGNFQYRFYEINEQLEPKELPELKAGEYFLSINYFGIKGGTSAVLSEKYKNQFIIDATQAFFMKGDGVSWLFNSCRKFFGVPDGAYLYTPAGTDIPIPATKNERYITDHLTKRLNGDTTGGYPFFLKNEELMDCNAVGMSEFSERLLSGIDYSYAIERRRANYRFLHERFNNINQFNALLWGDDVPMCYPLLLAKTIDKSKLYALNIFVPAFWKEVAERKFIGETEKNLTEKLLPLPIDHRYTIADMEYLAASLNNLL